MQSIVRPLKSPEEAMLKISSGNMERVSKLILQTGR
jgi:hypothetical protein